MLLLRVVLVQIVELKSFLILNVGTAGISQMQPGMPADVYIQTRARSALQYLLDPVMDSLNRSFREK